MKKIILNLIIISAFVTLLCGCESNNSNKVINNNINSQTNDKVTEKITINNVKSKIEELGIVTMEEEPYYQMVGAIDGIKIYSGESRVEIYKFDKKSDVYKSAENSQKLSLGDGYEFDAIVKNGYAYIIDSDFPSYNDVISILNNLN